MDTLETTALPGPKLQPWQFGASFAFGMMFGGVLYKSEVIRWARINAMFRFEEAHMYIIIAMAIAVAMPSMLLIKRFEAKTVTGEEVPIKDPPFQRGIIYGGLTFGVGWAITAACPGPIYAQIGAGEFAALATLVGAVGGMFIYSILQPRLPH
jgi:uncharacterized membrane protein YedE/YeeE